MKKKIKNTFNKKNKIKLKRSQKFARKLIEEKYILLSLKNRELVNENAKLLSEIETLKTEKTDIFKQLIHLMQKQNNNNKSSYLSTILETIKSHHKKAQELWTQSNASYNVMIETISDHMKQMTAEDCLQCTEDQNLEPNKGNAINSAQQLYERRQQSFQRIDRLYRKNYVDLSVIEEQSYERQTDSLIDKETAVEPLVCNNGLLKTPESVNNCSQSQYEITFENKSSDKFGTPSIYNFDCESFINKSPDDMSICSTKTSLSYQPLKSPELSVNSFETTVNNDETNAISTSTPRYNRKSRVAINPITSKRISSINKPYSPLASRTSLLNIQNVFDNKAKGRKSSFAKSDTKTITNSFGSESNDTNSIHTHKAKRKKCSSKSVNSETSDLSDVSNKSSSYSRRNRAVVSYKEPSLNRKIRRGDNDWSKY